MRIWLSALTALAVVTGLYLWVTRYDQTPPEQPAGAGAGVAASGVPLLALEPEAMASIDIAAHGYHVQLRHEPDGGWRVSGAEAPPGQVPDAAKLDDIAWGLANVTARRVAAGGDLAQFGLERPEAELTVTPQSGPPLRLRVGRRSDLAAAWYVQRTDDPDVYLWESGLPDDLPETAADFFAPPERPEAPEPPAE